MKTRRSAPSTAEILLNQLREAVARRAPIHTLPPSQRGMLTDFLIGVKPLCDRTPTIVPIVRALSDAWSSDRLQDVSPRQVDALREYLKKVGVV